MLVVWRRQRAGGRVVFASRDHAATERRSLLLAHTNGNTHHCAVLIAPALLAIIKRRDNGSSHTPLTREHDFSYNNYRFYVECTTRARCASDDCATKLLRPTIVRKHVCCFMANSKIRICHCYYRCELNTFRTKKIARIFDFLNLHKLYVKKNYKYLKSKQSQVGK